jgi:hypothetical protein
MRELVPELPEQLEELVAQMLSLDPAQRPATAGTVADTLLEIAKSLGCEMRPEGISALLLESFPGESYPYIDSTSFTIDESAFNSSTLQSLSQGAIGSSGTRSTPHPKTLTPSVPAPKVESKRPTFRATAYALAIVAAMALAGGLAYVLLGMP